MTVDPECVRHENDLFSRSFPFIRKQWYYSEQNKNQKIFNYFYILSRAVVKQDHFITHLLSFSNTLLWCSRIANLTLYVCSSAIKKSPPSVLPCKQYIPIPSNILQKQFSSLRTVRCLLYLYIYGWIPESKNDAISNGEETGDFLLHPPPPPYAWLMRGFTIEDYAMRQGRRGPEFPVSLVVKFLLRKIGEQIKIQHTVQPQLYHPHFATSTISDNISFDWFMNLFLLVNAKLCWHNTVSYVYLVVFSLLPTG